MAITVNSLGMEVRGLALGTNGQILSGSTRRAELLCGRAILKAWNHGWEDTPTSGTGERGRVGIINVWKNRKGQIWKCLSFLSFLFLLRFCSVVHFVFAPLSAPLLQEKTVGKRKMRKLQKTPTCYCFSLSLATCLWCMWAVFTRSPGWSRGARAALFAGY